MRVAGATLREIRDGDWGGALQGSKKAAILSVLGPLGANLLVEKARADKVGNRH